jgi:hypothetical protein
MPPELIAYALVALGVWLLSWVHLVPLGARGKSRTDAFGLALVAFLLSLAWLPLLIVTGFYLVVTTPLMLGSIFRHWREP